MLSIKSSPPQDPDPASQTLDTPQILFLEEEPEVVPQLLQQHQIASRIQGGPPSPAQAEPLKPADQDNISSKSPEQDVPEAALSEMYSKALHNQTTEQDQSPDGTVNIDPAAIIADTIQPEQEKTPAVKAIINTKDIIETVMNQKPEELNQKIDQTAKTILPEEILKTVITENKLRSMSDHDTTQPEQQKLISKKHRPAEVGLDNLSKIQLSKPAQEPTAIKKKLSLQDLQQGFSQFMRNGNEQLFSTQGNSQIDDAEGLRRASYYRQLGSMYQNAHAIAPALNQNLYADKTNGDSVVQVTIERSGKISDCRIVSSCGIDSLDQYHIKIIESIGMFPPIPKYIEAPLQIGATLYFTQSRSSIVNFMPRSRR